MSVQLDHALVPSHDRRAAAELLAGILGVPWAESGVGPFCPVFVNDGLTLDIDQAEGVFPVQHYCFRVSEAAFDAIVARLAAGGIAYRSMPHGPVDGQVNTRHGGRMVYWSEPDGHVWEALTVSYARQPPLQPVGQGDPQPAAAAPMQFWQPQPIESPRLRLRIVEEADIPALLGINGDDEVTRFLPYPTWRSVADGQAWFARYRALIASTTALQFVVIEKASDSIIGTCLLFRHEPASERMELGYVLGRAHWGQGLMREALSALISHAFTACGLRRLEAEVNPDNAASDTLLRRLGFSHEGVLRKRWAAKGVVYDVNVYGLLSDEWQRVPTSS
ncbi:MAG: GNAT family N-acetyltransferase [Burkholderiales bacterium]